MKVVFFEINNEEKGIIQNFLRDVPDIESIFYEGLFNIEQAKEADIISVFINSEIRKEEMDALPNLKFVTTRSTGHDHIDDVYAKEKGIMQKRFK